MSQNETNPPEPRRIVALTREHIGDLICTTPALRALRARFPQAHIAVEVGERAAGVLENNPNVDEIILRPDHQGLRGKARFIRLLRQRNFDLAVILDNSADMILYTWLGGVPRRAGMIYRKKFSALLTESVPFDRQAHEMVDNFRNVVALLGGDVSNAETEVFPSQNDKAFVAALFEKQSLRDGADVIALNPGASAPSNRWLPERFAELAERLMARLNTRVLLLGGPGDLELSEAICRNMEAPPLVLTGKLTLLQLAETLRRCHLLVTGDTGPMHLAVAMKTPTLVLFGPAVPQESGPGYAPGHQIIRKVSGCPQCTKYLCRANRECMRKITASEVAAAVESALAARCFPVGPDGIVNALSKKRSVNPPAREADCDSAPFRITVNENLSAKVAIRERARPGQSSE